LSYWRGVRDVSKVSLREDIPGLDQAREAVVNLEHCQEIQRAVMIKNMPYASGDKSTGQGSNDEGHDGPLASSCATVGCVMAATLRLRPQLSCPKRGMAARGARGPFVRGRVWELWDASRTRMRLSCSSTFSMNRGERDGLCRKPQL